MTAANANPKIYSVPRLKFNENREFQIELRRRIDKFFLSTGRRKRDCWQMYLKTAILGKALFFVIAFGIPMVFHAWWAVLFYYAVAVIFLGATMGVVFQIPHCNEAAAFPVPANGTDRMERPWAVHQAETTLDFAQDNPILTYFLGGLNYHLEHHLFPMICHINYPVMAKVVERTCKEFGVSYRVHATFLKGVTAHYKWLKKMGRPVMSYSSSDK